MTLKAIEVTDMDFGLYGKVYNMRTGGAGIKASSGDGWKDCFTLDPLIDEKGSLGNSLGSSAPFQATEMERHEHTQEALFCMDSPIVFLVAADEKGYPEASKAKAVIVRPGTVVVLHKGVWHSAAHGLGKEAYYYWFANAYEGEPTEWKNIVDEKITVTI